MKIYNEQYTVKSDKLLKDYVISLISDLHVTRAVSYRLLEKVIEQIKLQNPDVVLICGDMINGADDLLNKENRYKIEYLLGSLTNLRRTDGKKVAVFFTYGNHDLFKGKELSALYIDEYFKSLAEKLGFEILNNTSKEVEELAIFGFNPNQEVYFEKNQKDWDYYYIRDFRKANFEFLSKKFNIVQSHTPHIIYHPPVMEALKEETENVDLYTCGHAHGGLIPKFMLKSGIIKSSKGICCGQKGCNFLQVFDKCRGLHDVDEAKMVISSGIRKFVAPTPLFGFIDENMIAHDITTIKLERVRK